MKTKKLIKFKTQSTKEPNQFPQIESFQLSASIEQLQTPEISERKKTKQEHDDTMIELPQKQESQDFNSQRSEIIKEYIYNQNDKGLN